MRIFVTGIGTGVGKTVISALLVKALKADYWKPVQCGDLDHSDTDVIRELCGAEVLNIYPEAFRLKTPASPHHAAALEGLHITIDDIILPETDNHLIIEGAGGIMVPLNEDELFLDFAERKQLPVIIVSQNYLGSINHTLMTVGTLQRRQIEILGIIFNGKPAPSTEDVILRYTGLPCIYRLPWDEALSSGFLALHSQAMATSLKKMNIIA